MPLFNNFPYLNVQNLNLNWIISKIKGIDQTAEEVKELSVNLPEYAETASQAATAATTAANAADSAANSAVELLEQMNADADRAETAADNAEAFKNSAESYAGEAQAAASTARDAETGATQAAEEASESANGAAIDANTASNDALRAETAAQRAETAASTEGFTGRSGDIAAGASAEISILPGDYIITYKVNDTDSSSGLFMLHVTAAYTADIRKLITYTGSTGITLTVDSSLHTLKIRSTFTQAVHWLLLGFNNGQ